MNEYEKKRIEEIDEKFRAQMKELNPNVKFISDEQFEARIKHVTKKLGPALEMLAKGPDDEDLSH